MRDLTRIGLALSSALLLGPACGGSSERDASGGQPRSEADGAGTMAPSSPEPSSSNPEPPAPSAAPATEPTPPSSETPAVGNETPVVPSAPAEMSASGEAPDPPEMEETPPEMAEPPPEPPDPAPDPSFLVFLLLGQSNMEGAPASEAQDRVDNPRVKVLALRDCPQRGQVHDEWYTASPSLHTCGNTLGPGDYFGKVLADALPNATIGLVPDAIAGVDIDIFRKGVVSERRDEFFLPPDNQRDSAYDTVIERARLAQRVGVISGILFHQGESDAANGTLQAAWPGKVQELVEDIRTDLGLGNVPFLAGELLANGAPQNGCCGNAMNPRINSLPALIPEAFVVSGSGLGVQSDGLHFNVVGQREFGLRYATVMLDALGL